MKMKYEKPLVAVERYELSQSIASCAIKVGPNGSNGCIINNSENLGAMGSLAYVGYFTSVTGGCTMVPSIGQDFSGVCYHTQANAAFVS